MADAFGRPGGALLWPCATRAFQVTERGDLYNGVWAVRFDATGDGVAAGPPARVAARDRWRPELRWSRRAGDVRWMFEAVAFPGGAPGDSGLVVSLSALATNEGRTPHAASLSATLAPPDAPPPFAAWDAPDSLRAPLRWASPGTRGIANGWSQTPVAGATFRFEATLAPGESRGTLLLLPTFALPAGELSRLALTSHARRVADTQRRWDRWLAEGTVFTLGEPETENALRAAEIMLLSCRERRGAHTVPIGGPFQYRDVWLRDGARLVAALAVVGHAAEARDLAAGMEALQWPNGVFLSQRGQLDGSGQALWAFGQALLREPPSAVRERAIEEAVEPGLRAWRWIERQRAAGRGSGAFPAGLMPFGDPRDGEVVRAPLVGNDAWSIAGYRALERLLRAGGRTPGADSVAASLADYLTRFRGALEATRRPDVPPAWTPGGHDWGNLAVGWPCEALAADDPHLAATARRVWAEAGGAGLVCYGARDSLHGYVGADLGTWALLAGRRGQADSVLAALLHWRTASGTAGELFSRAGDYGANLPPHPTSAAALVALVRNAILYDDADTLRLTLGAREAWWRGASVHGAPTWWGPVDLEFRAANGEASWKWTPVPVWTALTLPPGVRVRGALPPPLVPGGREGVVLAPPGTRQARVRIASAS